MQNFWLRSLQENGCKDLGRYKWIILAARNYDRIPAAYFCIKAFSETDFTDDLKKIDVPTLILQGDDDQIVPIATSTPLSSKIIKNATQSSQVRTHGMCTTHKHQVNTDLLAFLQGIDWQPSKAYVYFFVLNCLFFFQFSFRLFQSLILLFA